jgi:hypothetical protein
LRAQTLGTILTRASCTALSPLSLLLRISEAFEKVNTVIFEPALSHCCQVGVISAVHRGDGPVQVEPLQDGVGDLGQSADLVWGEGIDDVLSHIGNVSRSALLDLAPSGVG